MLDITKPFYILINASDIGRGATLLQQQFTETGGTNFRKFMTTHNN